MGDRKRTDFHPEDFTDETADIIHQLGELKDLDLEKCISELIKRSNSSIIANKILQKLEIMNIESPKISDKDRSRNSMKIEQLYESLKSKNLTPMEKRYIYEEIADLIKDMDSIRRYWLQKSLTGVKYVGAAGAVFAATLLFRKRK